MNKRGFTLVELLGVIIILSILLVIAVGAYARYLQKSRQKTFDIAVNSLEDSARSAYVNCRSTVGKSKFCDTHSLDDITTSETVTLQELVDNYYIDPIKNPYDKEQYCDAQNSYVTVTRDDATGINFSYKACLVCGTERSSGCDE